MEPFAEQFWGDLMEKQNLKVVKGELLMGGSPVKVLVVNESTYKRLKSWASVGRTIDEAVRLLEEHSHMEDGQGAEAEPIDNCISELLDLKQALDDCGHASKR